MPDKLAWGQSTLKLWGIKRLPACRIQNDRLEAYPTSKIGQIEIRRMPKKLSI